MQELKTLFDEMFLSCAYGFESMRTISQNWLADVSGQLKTTVPLLKMQLLPLDLLWLDQCLKSLFIIFYLNLFY